MQYDPVTIADLVSGGAELTAHCRRCGHWKTVNPVGLPDRFDSRTLPSLEGAFRCSRCGSRNTCAMPLYAPQKRDYRQSGAGWIMPPGSDPIRPK